MKRYGLHNIGFVVAILLATILFFVVQRGAWLVYYHAQSGAFTGGDIMRTFVYGLHLDASTAGYVAALPLLASLATIWLPDGRRAERIWRRAATIYFVAVAAVMSWIFTVDMGLFEYWQTRIDSQILIYSPREMLASLTPWQFIAGTLYFAASAALLVASYRAIYRRLFTVRHQQRRMLSTVVLLLAAGALFATIRGGFSPAVANVSKVYFSREMFLNQAAVNPVFSFISTTVGGDDYDRYRFFDEERAEELFAEAIYGDAADTGNTTGITADTADRWLLTDRPHIVLVIMEGFGRTMTDAEWGGEPVAPNINALKKEGIWFENLYASSFRTDRGTVATLSGFPSQPQMSIMKDVRKAAALPSLARSLAREGYRSRFFYGGDANFTNTRAYLFSTGFDEVVDQQDIAAGEMSKWGYADDAVMEHVARCIVEAAGQDTPHFDVWLTLSSHEPFEVPYSRLDNRLLNAFAFTDEVIGELVGRLKASPAWDDMLLILIPDHGYQYPEEIGYNTPRRHHIPMLWLGGAVAQPMTVGEYAAQTDLAATLLGQLGIVHDDFTFSRDLSRRGTTRFGYYTFNNGFGVVDSLGTTIYDCTADMTLLDENDDDGKRLGRGKALLQKTFSEIRKL